MRHTRYANQSVDDIGQELRENGRPVVSSNHRLVDRRPLYPDGDKPPRLVECKTRHIQTSPQSTLAARHKSGHSMHPLLLLRLKSSHRGNLVRHQHNPWCSSTRKNAHHEASERRRSSQGLNVNARVHGTANMSIVHDSSHLEDEAMLKYFPAYYQEKR